MFFENIIFLKITIKYLVKFMKSVICMNWAFWLFQYKITVLNANCQKGLIYDLQLSSFLMHFILNFVMMIIIVIIIINTNNVQSLFEIF